MKHSNKMFLAVLVLFVVQTLAVGSASAAKKPNFLIIWGDDIGYWNLSAYNQGMMGYRTPNIDRIAKGGMLFTDAYGEQSCTAGRAAFVTGQSGFRTGLLKVGLPGAKEGIKKEDPTIAEYLKSKGYATAQYGKNHFGDRDEHLPSMERTTSAIAMSTCLPNTGSTSSSATYITSTPRKSRRTRTIRTTRPSMSSGLLIRSSPLRLTKACVASAIGRERA